MPAPKFSFRSASAPALVGLALGLIGCGEADQKQGNIVSTPAPAGAAAPRAYASRVGPLPAARPEGMAGMGMMGGRMMGGPGQMEFMRKGMGGMMAPADAAAEPAP